MLNDGRDTPVTAFSEEGQRSIQKRMSQLCMDVAAVGALLLDPSGQLLVESGRRGNFHTATFLALLGNAMAAANEASRLLKDKEAFDLHFHEGDEYELYTARITDQIFLCLVLDRRGSSRIGMVWLYLRRAIAEFRSLLAEAALTVGASIGEDLEAALGSALDMVLAPGAPPPTEPKRTPEEIGADLLPPLEPSAPPPDVEVVPTVLESAPEPIEPAPAMDGERVLSYEEARALGLISLDQLGNSSSEIE